MFKVAHAILLVNKKYVLQLRDNKPKLIASGKWSLFGGEINEGEAPEVGIVREIKEELCLSLENFRFLWNYERKNDLGTLTSYFFFEADVTHLWKQHQLMEGQAARCFDFKELSALDIPPFIQKILFRHHTENPL
ncbi:NUDIX domain-containing protein [Nitrospinaceae bacterium]|nr:NUDIX domain-containing protein [Nitrospinaceae bacterium]